MNIRGRIVDASTVGYPYASITMQLSRDDEAFNVNDYGGRIRTDHVLYAASAEDLIAVGTELVRLGNELMQQEGRLYAPEPARDTQTDLAPVQEEVQS